MTEAPVGTSIQGDAGRARARSAGLLRLLCCCTWAPREGVAFQPPAPSWQALRSWDRLPPPLGDVRGAPRAQGTRGAAQSPWQR